MSTLTWKGFPYTNEGDKWVAILGDKRVVVESEAAIKRAITRFRKKGGKPEGEGTTKTEEPKPEAKASTTDETPTTAAKRGGTVTICHRMLENPEETVVNGIKFIKGRAEVDEKTAEKFVTKWPDSFCYPSR